MSSLFDAPQTLARPRYISHRGFQPLAPENSLASFNYAGKLGQWAIETDVHFTRDGVAVCCHNDTVDAHYNGSGPIRDKTWAELSRLRINHGNRLECLSDEERRMPLFSEYLAICKRWHSVPFVELKTADAEQVVQAVREAGFGDDEVVMSSGCLEYLEAVRAVSPTMFVHWIFAEEERLTELATLGNAGLSWNMTNLRDSAVQKHIARAHDMGLRVCLRAGDSLKAVERMLSLGLDYIPTNCMHASLQADASASV